MHRRWASLCLRHAGLLIAASDTAYLTYGVALRRMYDTTVDNPTLLYSGLASSFRHVIHRLSK